jgi:hypothetical protein
MKEFDPKRAREQLQLLKLRARKLERQIQRHMREQLLGASLALYKAKEADALADEVRGFLADEQQ